MEREAFGTLFACNCQRLVIEAMPLSVTRKRVCWRQRFAIRCRNAITHGGRSQSAACGEKHGRQDEIARQARARQAGERRGDLAAELLQVGHELGVA